jgi:hypothetical protein
VDNAEVDIKGIKEFIFDDLFKINTNKRIKVCSVLEMARYIEQKLTFIDSDFIICINSDLSSMDLTIYGDLEEDEESEDDYYGVFLYKQTKPYYVYGAYEDIEDSTACVKVEDAEKYLDNLDIILSNIKNIINKNI